MNLNGVDNSNNAVDRFWCINYADYTTIPVSQFIMTYDAANDLNGIAESDLQAQYWDGSKWVLPPTGVANPAGDNVNSIPNVAANAPWILVNNNFPMPIELVLFDCKCNNRNLYFEWVTASELNNNYFTIQKSPNAADWEDVALIEGAGNSNQILNYSFSLLYEEGVNYYRLIQTDFDGTTSVHKIVFSNCDKNEIINIYPNPSREGEKILIYGEPYSIEIYDVTGRTVNATTIDNQVTGLSSGIYVFIINNNYQAKIIIE